MQTKKSRKKRDPILIPLEAMTNEQIQIKVGEQRKMSVGCAKHADELERYLETRKGARTA